MKQKATRDERILMNGSINYCDTPEAAESKDEETVETLAEVLDGDHRRSSALQSGCWGSQ